ncbi:hypothetical protein Apa02nite_066940 [Actinoplanes palleronii]|uniref:HTH luxR-type domain-containing protein n=2 Tax=Actinoplanes palleronii TaxID=113570 RepID=A0ABQ4BJW1_9ACTN|nr:hypothetical protein Apa02nite_066940 [Actinoplanes palleronii]
MGRLEGMSLAAFGSAVSGTAGRTVPHDGYQLRALDPITGVGCLAVTENAYRPSAARRLEINDAGGRDLHSLAALTGAGRRVGVLGTGARAERHSERLHDLMAADGFGSELRVALVHAGITWGTLTLLRERGSRPFSPADADRAERLSAPLAVALKNFVTSRPPRPFTHRSAPGVVVVEADDGVRPTAAGRAWLARLLPPSAATDDDTLFANLWSVVYAARRTGGEALTRIPAGGGWLAMHAQPLDAALVVTIQPAAADQLLPAFAAWHDLTARERTVLDQVRAGRAAKQIATRLRLSPYTVNDHLKAIYRKTGVSGRDELLAALTC